MNAEEILRRMRMAQTIVLISFFVILALIIATWIPTALKPPPYQYSTEIHFLHGIGQALFLVSAIMILMLIYLPITLWLEDRIELAIALAEEKTRKLVEGE